MTSISIQKNTFSPTSVCLKALGLGTLIPLAIYVILPLLGVGLFSNLFSLKMVLGLPLLIFSGIAYFFYIKILIKKPEWLIYFMVAAWPVVEWINNVLLYFHNINIHFRLILLAAIILPALWHIVRNVGLLWRHFSYLKYYIFFCLWLGLYFFFYNANAYDPRWGLETMFSEGSVCIIQASAYLYILIGMALAGTTMLTCREPRKFFDILNVWLLVISSLCSIVTIALYPLEISSVYLDGFQRAVGIFTHPNPFSHHMGILLLYQLGLFCYYQDIHKNRIPQWLLITGLIVNAIALLLGLSKTAIAVFSGCAMILMLLNLSTPVVRRNFAKLTMIALILVPIGLGVFALITDQSFFSLLEARLDSTNSYVWRNEIWSDLLGNIHSWDWLTGHGFTASNAWVFHLTFNDLKNAKPLMMVHNGYIALFYDFGILGYSLFIAALSLMWQAFRQLVRPDGISPFLGTIIALSLYFLIVCGFDEMTYMFDAPRLFWTFSTLLLALHVRENMMGDTAQ